MCVCVCVCVSKLFGSAKQSANKFAAKVNFLCAGLTPFIYIQYVALLFTAAKVAFS